MNTAAVGLLLVGSELTDGRVPDKHLSWLAVTLMPLNMRIKEVVIIADDAPRCQSSLRRLLADYDLVICCGGLGPTQDDMTKQVLSAVIGRPVETGKSITDGFCYLANSVGTAPGLLGMHHETILAALPGPPVELQPMVDTHLVPLLRQWVQTGMTRDGFAQSIAALKAAVPPVPTADAQPPPSPSAAHPRTDLLLSVFDIPESVLDKTIAEIVRKHNADTPREDTVGWGTRMGQWQVDLLLYGARLHVLRRIAVLLRRRLGRFAVVIGPQSLSGLVITRLHLCGERLATVESCTGGFTAAALTAVPGASRVFWGGSIPYCIPAKLNMGISDAVIREHGTVSEEVTALMAQSILQTGSQTAGETAPTVALAICGATGPDPADKGVRPGTAVITIADIRGNTSSARAALPERYSREKMQSRMAVAAQLALLGHVQRYAPAFH